MRNVQLERRNKQMPSKKAEMELTFDVDDTALEIPDEDSTVAFDTLNIVEDGDEDDGLELLSEEQIETNPFENPQPSVGVNLSDIEALITDIDDSVEFLTWLIYGKNGTGKTTLLSTVEGTLILAAEDGTLSIKDKAKGKAKKIAVNKWEVIEGVYWLLKNSPVEKNTDGSIAGIRIQTKDGSFLVKSIAFDTITKLADICMRNVVLGEKETDPSKDILKKTMKNWGDMSEKMKYWLQMFQDFPIQKIWLFQEGTNSEDVDSEEFNIFPQVNKSLRAYAMSEADVIARTYIAKVATGIQFRLSAAPNDKYVTKDRTNKLKIVANPSLSSIYKLVFGKEI
jgi:energy-coupling factor transporter ATP-binding protein EcfA2